MIPRDFLQPKYVAWLIDGFGVTLTLSSLVSIAALALGFLLCIAGHSPRRSVRLPVAAVLSALRNTPLLVQLFFWYFGVSALLPREWMQWLNAPSLSLFGVTWPAYEYLAGFTGLTLYSAAFIAAEFQAGVNGVAKGQITAGRALGLTDAQIWLSVVLPQALRNAFTPLTGQVMNVVKNSSLTMAIGLAELSYSARQVETETFRAFQAFGAATVLYILAIALIEALSQGLRCADPVRRAMRL